MSRPQHFGRYELLDRISAGGMAEVFRARDTATGTIVALKRILPQIAEDEEFIRMFEDEARITAQLEHPHIARTLDFGHVDESYYIAFEFVDGRDLRTLFDRAVRMREHPPLSILVHVFTRIGEGLSYAHSRRDARGEPVSIVHRDVSPQNIVVSYGGDVKLIDFGIAKAAGKLSRTQVGTLKGKFGYMSPEQVKGHDVDHRADVFSLGICMWELLTLQRLFSGDNELIVLEKVRSLTSEPPSRANPEVPPALDRIVLKALAKDVNDRYRAAKDLYRDLNHFAEECGSIASREEVAQYMRRAFPESSGRLPPLEGAAPNVSLKERNLETRAMAADNKGSDLDIFEGLGKKNASRPSTAPPPPPRAAVPAAPPSPMPAPVSANVAAPSFPAPSAPPPAPAASAVPPPGVGGVRLDRNDLATKKTLMGMSSPAPGARALTPPPRSAPPPPPGRGSLPQVVPPPQKASSSNHPPALGATGGASARTPSIAPIGSGTGSMSAPAIASPSTAPKPINAHLDMDWDDEDEATHIFDKAQTEEIGAMLSDRPRPAAGTPLAPPASMRPHQTLMGMTSPSQAPSSGLGPTGGSAQPMFRSAPPPSGQPAFARTLERENVNGPPTPGPMAFPPSSLEGNAQGAPQGMQMPATAPAMAPQINTAPMPMPGQHRNHPTLPPSGYAPDPPVPAYPIMGNRMEATQMVRPQALSGRVGVVGTGVAFAALAAGLVIFIMMPRNGRIAVNVADAKGGSVQHVEIFVDGKKECDTAPCIVNEVAAGPHNVKVLSVGFDPPADRTVSVESRKDAQLDFALTTAGLKSGTGIRVSGPQQGVKLFVDGKEIGPLPQELRDLSPGDHQVRLAGTDRYAPVEKSVIVAKDEMQDLGDMKLKVVKGKATITLGTLGARVSIVSGTDRREFPSLPIAVDLDTSKSWALEASKAGYADYHQPVSFDDGQAEKTFNIVLEPKSVSMASPFSGSSPSPAGAPHPVAPSPKPAPVAADTSGDTAAPAATGDAFLNINSIPASSVVLDGKPIGNTPKVHVPVTAGNHSVLFVNAEQGLKKQISVSVASGETKPAIAKLRE